MLEDLFSFLPEMEQDSYSVELHIRYLSSIWFLQQLFTIVNSFYGLNSSLISLMQIKSFSCLKTYFHFFKKPKWRWTFCEGNTLRPWWNPLVFMVVTLSTRNKTNLRFRRSIKRNYCASNPFHVDPWYHLKCTISGMISFINHRSVNLLWTSSLNVASYLNLLVCQNHIEDLIEQLIRKIESIWTEQGGLLSLFFLMACTIIGPDNAKSVLVSDMISLMEFLML